MSLHLFYGATAAVARRQPKWGINFCDGNNPAEGENIKCKALSSVALEVRGIGLNRENQNGFAAHRRAALRAIAVGSLIVFYLCFN